MYVDLDRHSGREKGGGERRKEKEKGKKRKKGGEGRKGKLKEANKCYIVRYWRYYHRRKGGKLMGLNG
jgi:hypothetical protein